MTSTATLAPQALRDLLAAARWIAGDNTSTATALRIAITATLILAPLPPGEEGTRREAVGR
jgi:plasmid stabilization system protein ParE